MILAFQGSYQPKISPLHSVCNLKSNQEAVLQQVNPSKPHCGKTENAADLSARSTFTRQRRFFFLWVFFTRKLTVEYRRRGGDQKRQKSTAREVFTLEEHSPISAFTCLQKLRGITNNVQDSLLSTLNKPNYFLTI